MTEPVTTIGIITLIISGGAMWIREWKRGQSAKSNNDDLKAIKKKADCIDEKVGKIKTSVTQIQTSMEGMQRHCRETTQRFEKDINENRKEILDLTKIRR